MNTMRDDLNAALDADDGDFDETTQEVITDDIEPEVQEENIEADVETAETSEEEVVEAVQATTDETVEIEDTKELKSGDSIKAPMDWGPKEREDWSKIPRHLQEKVMSREKELNTMLQTTADARRTHDEFGKLTQQYGSVLSGVMGDTPMETVSTLFSTVANLRMGSPIQKAQIVADLISDFGVDINTLDSAIVGAAPAQENNQFDQMLTERLAPFEKMMGQQNAYQQQQATQNTQAANDEVQAFAAKAEFLGDVRQDMADLIEMAGSRGHKMTMEEAYGKACALNPQITSIMQERQQRENLKGNNNSMAGKRNAASSVNGQRIGNGAGGGGNMTMHDTISAAWDNQNSI